MAASERQKTISLRYAWKIVLSAEAAGLPRNLLCREANLPLFEKPSPDQRIAADQYLDLWSIVMRHVRDPAFPIRTACLPTPDPDDLVGFIAMSSPTVRVALERMARYFG